MCPSCLYLKSASNHKPCYECRLGSEYEKDENIFKEC